jgi:hypothetical protein
MTNLFKDNWHARVYEELISRAQTRDLKKLPVIHRDYVYCEKHHIVPRSIGGSNVASNLVNLTAREHFIAHMLLPRMCISQNHRLRLNCAISMMRTECKNSSRSYQRERLRVIREGFSEDHCRKISLANKGKKFPPRTAEHLAKLSAALTGKMKNVPKSEDHKRKIGDTNRGKKKPPRTKEHQEKMTIAIAATHARKKAERERLSLSAI